MTRYLVGSPAQLELVRLSIARHGGYIDASGQPVRCVHRMVDVASGRVVAEIPSELLPPSMPVGADALVHGDDGQAVLELPDTGEVGRALGKTVQGVAIPRERDLVTNEAALPTSVVRALDDRRARALTDDDLIATIGRDRALAARSRVASKQALERALGR